MGFRVNSSSGSINNESFGTVSSSGDSVFERVTSNGKRIKGVNHNIDSVSESHNTLKSKSRNVNYSYSMEGSTVLRFFSLMTFILAFFTAYRIIYIDTYTFSVSNIINGLNIIFSTNPFGIALSTISNVGNWFGSVLGIIAFLVTLPIACINYIIEIFIFIISGNVIDFNTPVLTFIARFVTIGQFDSSISFWEWLKNMVKIL